MPKGVAAPRLFRVPGLFVLPDLRDLVPAGPVAEVDSATMTSRLEVYHDTDDLGLTREGIGLRQRTSGHDSCWQLRFPQPGVGGLDLPRGGEPPRAFRDLVLVWVRFAPLRPVATLRTDRTRHRLLDRDGALLVQLDDDVVTVLDGRRVAARFRELRLRPADDPPASAGVTQLVGGALVAAGATAKPPVPAIVHALGGWATAEPDPPHPRPVTADDPAGSVVAAHLRTHVRALMAVDPLVRSGVPDSVHQMRVAVRRLRSGLRTFGLLLEASWAAALTAELGWLAAVLGDARDREVLLERLCADLDRLPPGLVLGPVGATLRSTIGADLDHARAVVLSTLRGARYLQLVERLVAAAKAPEFTEAADRPAAEALAPLVGGAWRALAARADRLAGRGNGRRVPDERFHRTRISAKRARYALEECVGVYGRPASTLARRVAAVQEVLGEHQDAAVAARVLQQLSTEAGLSAGSGFTLGILYARQRIASERARAEFAEVWRSALAAASGPGAVRCLAA
jgi:CHAD domain-containing protein